MKLVKAFVEKRSTEDGVVFLLDEVPLGFAYLVDLSSLRRAVWLDRNTGKQTERETITVYGSATGRCPIGPMPLELFRLEES